MATTPYITAAQLEARLRSDTSFGQPLAPAYANLLDDACIHASAIVNDYVGRGQAFAFETLGSTEVPRQRTYTGDGRAVLVLDQPLQTFVGADNNGTAIAASDLWLEPINETPARSLRLKPTAPATTWSSDLYSVTVAGVWGWGAPSESIIEAVLEIAVRIVKGRDAGYSDVVGIEGEGTARYVKALPPLIKVALDLARERCTPQRLFT